MQFTIRKAIAQQIVETVNDVCEYDVNFIDPKGIIYASTNQERIGDYHEIGYRAAQTGETLEVTEVDHFKGTMKGINLPFFYNGDIIGVIGITGDPEEVRKYGYLAQRIASLILKEQEMNFRASSKQSMLHYCIHALAAHESISDDFYNLFLETFHVEEDAVYRCILVHISSRNSRPGYSMLTDKINHAFEKTGSLLFTSNYPRKFILFLTEKQYKENIRHLEKLAAENADALKIGVGFSTELSSIHKSYQAAYIAQKSADAVHSLICFDDLTLEILLEEIPEESRDLYLAKTIRNLKEADLTLLETYFSRNCSLKETSEVLFQHKNTVQYHLDRITRDTGLNPRTFKDAVILSLALKLH